MQNFDCNSKPPDDDKHPTLLACDSATSPTTIFLLGPIIVPGTEISSASAQAPNGTNLQWAVSLNLKSTGQKAWANYTTAHNTAAPGEHDLDHNVRYDHHTLRGLRRLHVGRRGRFLAVQPAGDQWCRHADQWQLRSEERDGTGQPAQVRCPATQLQPADHGLGHRDAGHSVSSRPAYWPALSACCLSSCTRCSTTGRWVWSRSRH